MYAEIKLLMANGEERTVPMLATASTPIRFKMIYGQDLVTGLIDSTGEFDIDIVGKLAFLMSKQAAKVDMTTLDQKQYLEWLDDFDSMAFIDKAEEVFEVYIKSRNNSSKAKKQGARLREK